MAKRRSKKVELEIVVWTEGRSYVAQCLNVDVSSFGKTKTEALRNINEALELFFEDMPSQKVHAVKNPEIVEQSLTYA